MKTDAVDCFEDYEPGLYWKVVEQIDNRSVLCEVVRNDSDARRNLGFVPGHRRTFELDRVVFKVKNQQSQINFKRDSLVDLKARLAGKSSYERLIMLEEYVFGERLS